MPFSEAEKVDMQLDGEWTVIAERDRDKAEEAARKDTERWLQLDSVAVARIEKVLPVYR